eukprot:13636286-Alexandrium_andersonii.AAC.1
MSRRSTWAIWNGIPRRRPSGSRKWATVSPKFGIADPYGLTEEPRRRHRVLRPGAHRGLDHPAAS